MECKDPWTMEWNGINTFRALSVVRPDELVVADLRIGLADLGPGLDADAVADLDAPASTMLMLPMEAPAPTLPAIPENQPTMAPGRILEPYPGSTPEATPAPSAMAPAAVTEGSKRLGRSRKSNERILFHGEEIV